MRTVLLILPLLLILTATAEARMYQWTNPATGTVQLAGAPPAWYRSGAPAPRVFVFENGRLIDDTAVPVTETQRLNLRGAAFGETAEDRPPPAGDDETELRAALTKASERGVDVDAIASEFATDRTQPAAAPSDAATATAEKAAALKAMIDAWDQQQLEQARSLLELLPAVTPPSSRSGAAGD